jgi:hypothetical protein
MTSELVKTCQSLIGVETCMHLTCTNMPAEKVDNALRVRNTAILCDTSCPSLSRRPAGVDPQPYTVWDDPITNWNDYRKPSYKAAGTFSLFAATPLLVKIPGQLLRVALLTESISFDISESTMGITSRSRSQASHNM